jgi:hypothetical protein
MRRRDLLATIAVGTAGVSGCSGLFGSGEDPETETATPYEVPTAERTPRVPVETTAEERTVDLTDWPGAADAPALARFRTTPRTLALAPVRFGTDDGLVFAVRVDATATADHPARIRTLLYNTNDFPKTVQRGRFPLLGRTVPAGTYQSPVARSPGLGELYLVPTPSHDIYDRRFESVARDDSGAWRADLHPGDYPQGGTVTVDAGGAVLGDYAVCAGRGGGPLTPGNYWFNGPNTGAAETAEQPLIATVWPTDAPGPATGSRFPRDHDPEFGGETPVRWFHRARAATERYLLPDSERVELPGRLRLWLVNRTDNWYGGVVRFYKRSGGRWYDLGAAGTGTRSLGPHQRRVRMPAGVHPTGVAQFERRFADGPPAGPDALGYLAGGRYAAVVDADGVDERYGALLDVTGPSLTARPEYGVSVTRDGPVVTVTDSGVSGPGDATATATARRVDTEPAVWLIDEQLMSRYGPAVRNTLTVFADGVETVRYHAADQLQSIQLGRVTGQPVRYDGVTATISLQRHEPVQ